MAKSNLPNNSLTNDNLTAEAIHLTTLYNTKPRSSSGQVSFISLTSGVTYTTLGSDFDNQGQEGLLQVLQLALDNYLVTADDYNSLVDDISSHVANISNPHAVTASQLGAIPLTQKGVANGVGSLDINGHPVEKTYAIGAYTGDDVIARTINLGFRPSSVLIYPFFNGATIGIPTDFYSTSSGSGYARTYIRGGLFIDGVSTLCSITSYSKTVSVTPVSIEDNGFKVYTNSSSVTVPETGNLLEIYSQTNKVGYSYRYIAFR